MKPVEALSPILRTESLDLRVPGRLLARSISLRVHRGETWAILGPNGAGKTLLLHTLAGLRPPQGGEVLLGGRPIGMWTLAEAARVRGLVPQSVHDAFEASVMEIVLLGRHPCLPPWQWEGEADRRLAEQALETVGLCGYAGREVTSLSGGERQRVSIATLLVHDPELMLLDEPLAHLDLANQVGVLRVLAALAGRAAKAVMLSIHDLSLAARFCTHALLLGGDGRSWRGCIDEVMTEGLLTEAFGYPVHGAATAVGRVFTPG